MCTVEGNGSSLQLNCYLGLAHCRIEEKLEVLSFAAGFLLQSQLTSWASSLSTLATSASMGDFFMFASAIVIVSCANAANGWCGRERQKAESFNGN